MANSVLGYMVLVVSVVISFYLNYFLYSEMMPFISILLFIVVYFLYASFRPVNIPIRTAASADTEGEDLIVAPELRAFWWHAQQKRLSGPFLDVPPTPEEYNVTSIVNADIFEVEAQALYYTIENMQAMLPWSQTNTIQYYDQPVPVRIPSSFVNEIQDFPLRSSIRQMQCPTCIGRGLLTCDKCHGRGHVRCTHCGGDGYNMRTRTRNGKTERYRDDCSWCRNGRRRCDRCNGRGDLVCHTCNGEGSVGQYTIERWNFIHWINQRLMTQIEDGTYADAEITDLPNELAKPMDYLNMDNIDEYIEEDPEGIFKYLQESALVLKGQMAQLPNKQFDAYSFRYAPKLMLKVEYKDKSYNLTSRGFPPINPTICDLPDVPINPIKLVLTSILPILSIAVAFLPL
ncbi:MAG: hypothetical protein INQ03_22590 [Candidatus Heimdallarchaeota archaeon]|nr:hypothetical protein [Candidatus Heimdallarchaeota archaeon]